MSIVIGGLFRIESKWHPHLHGEAIVHAGRKHADDRVWLAVHADLFTEDVNVGSKVTAPHSVAKYRDVVAARLAFFRKKVATEKHRQSFHLEESGCPG